MILTVLNTVMVEQQKAHEKALWLELYGILSVRILSVGFDTIGIQFCGACVILSDSGNKQGWSASST